MMNLWINWFISLLYTNNKLMELPSLTEIDTDTDYLDEYTWVTNKIKFWEKNNIFPIIIKDETMIPEELS